MSDNLFELLGIADGIIANVSKGNWAGQAESWQKAASEFRRCYYIQKPATVAVPWNSAQELPVSGRVVELKDSGSKFLFNYFDSLTRLWIGADGAGHLPQEWRHPYPDVKLGVTFYRRQLDETALKDRVNAHQITNDEPAESVPGGFAAQVIDTVRARGNSYGSPAENHQLTADLLSSWLRRRFPDGKIVLSAEDVCLINIIQKISRLANVSKDDSWLDIAGYTENVAMIRPDQRNFRVESKKLDGHNRTA